MKRILGTLLGIALVCAVAVPVFAGAPDMSPSIHDGVYFKSNPGNTSQKDDTLYAYRYHKITEIRVRATGYTADVCTLNLYQSTTLSSPIATLYYRIGSSTVDTTFTWEFDPLYVTCEAVKADHDGPWEIVTFQDYWGGVDVGLTTAVGAQAATAPW